MLRMAFQSNVFLKSGLSVPGELYADDPKRSQSYILQSSDPAFNIVGATAYTVSFEGIAAAGDPTAGAGPVFAGFLVLPKSYALFGANGAALDPTLVLPNETQADLLSMGSIVVTLPAPAQIGDVVFYNQVDGSLITQPQGSGVPAGYNYANAFVSYYEVTAPGLAVITVNPTDINV
jgi:hypothetical protein